MNGYRLKAFKVNHNVICYGYTLELDRAGKFQLEKAMAMDIPKMYWSRLQKGETIVDELQGKTYLPEMVMGAQRKGIKLTYCTDTRPTQSIVDNAACTQICLSVKVCMERKIRMPRRENIST